MSSGAIAGIVISLFLCVIGVGVYIIWKKKRTASKAVSRRSDSDSDNGRDGRASITKRRRSESTECVFGSEGESEDEDRDERPAPRTRNQSARLLSAPKAGEFVP